MKEQAIDKRVKEYYDTQQLRPAKLDELMALAEDSSQITTPHAVPQNGLKKLGRRWFRQRDLALAACVLAFIFTTVYILQPKHFSPAELATLVSKEIALNHDKRLPLEFKTQDYAELYSQMNKLSFQPHSPNRIQAAGLKLVGARYCSIHGQLATQSKLLDEKGEYYTLYQAELNDDLSRLPEGEYSVNGVLVQQWQEAGFFFGLARNPR